MQGIVTYADWMDKGASAANTETQKNQYSIFIVRGCSIVIIN